MLRSPDLETHEVHDTLHLGVEVVHAATFGIFLKLCKAIEDFLQLRGVLLNRFLLEFVLQEAVRLRGRNCEELGGLFFVDSALIACIFKAAADM